MRNKKGVLGLDTVKAVIVILLILAVLVLASMLILNSIRSSYETAEAKTSGQLNNETSAVNSAAGIRLNADVLYRNAVCTIIYVSNGSMASDIIQSPNYSQYGAGGCIVKNLTNLPTYSGYRPWNVTYTFTYNTNYVYGITANVSSGTTGFFTNVPTFFTLLGVVVLILIIAIVIVAVSRFSGGGNEGNFNVGGGPRGISEGL